MKGGYVKAAGTIASHSSYGTGTSRSIAWPGPPRVFRWPSTSSSQLPQGFEHCAGWSWVLWRVVIYRPPTATQAGGLFLQVPPSRLSPSDSPSSSVIRLVPYPDHPIKARLFRSELVAFPVSSIFLKESSCRECSLQARVEAGTEAAVPTRSPRFLAFLEHQDLSTRRPFLAPGLPGPRGTVGILEVTVGANIFETHCLCAY